MVLLHIMNLIKPLSTSSKSPSLPPRSPSLPKNIFKKSKVEADLTFFLIKLVTAHIQDNNHDDDHQKLKRKKLPATAEKKIVNDLYSNSN